LSEEWLWVIGIGFVVGLIGKLLRRERDPGGFFMPMLVGMGGAALAALVGPTMGLFFLGTLPGYLAVTASAAVLVFLLTVLHR
jgi:uncharacterized membrane protein YeaQ/YmgE (transglycosylase-associated protein family)